MGFGSGHISKKVLVSGELILYLLIKVCFIDYILGRFLGLVMQLTDTKVTHQEVFQAWFSLKKHGVPKRVVDLLWKGTI